MGRIALRLFTREDGWIHALPGIGAKWTQTRDLRGLPDQTFHEWWEKNRDRGNKGPREKGRKRTSDRGNKGADGQ
jgi:L-lactate dehydrogenase complex protein LldF